MKEKGKNVIGGIWGVFESRTNHSWKKKKVPCMVVRISIYLGLGSLTQGKDRGSGIDSCLFPLV